VVEVEWTTARLVRKSQEGDRLHGSGRGGGGGTRVKRAGFIKGDIPRYPHLTGNRVVAAITLMLRTVSKKNTLNVLSSLLSALTGREKNKAGTPKATKMTVVGWMAKQTLIWDTTLKN